MIIRKLFKFNGMHVVRNCSSERCKFSIHGHTYTVEIFIKSNGLDNGQMVLDFGLMKTTIKDLIKSFDGSYSLWNKESDDFKEFVYSNADRIVELPMSPSAESYSLMLTFLLDKVLKGTQFNNGEQEVSISSVRVHETETGYAETFIEDLKTFDYKKFMLEDFKFSKAIMESWSDPKFFFKLKQSVLGPKVFVNNRVEQQV